MFRFCSKPPSLNHLTAVSDHIQFRSLWIASIHSVNDYLAIDGGE